MGGWLWEFGELRGKLFMDEINFNRGCGQDWLKKIFRGCKIFLGGRGN